MPRKFSKSSPTFESWLKQAPPTAYTKRIERGHALRPTATLAQLRRHPRKGERALGRLKGAPMSKISWEALTPREKEIRIRSLRVISKMRRKGHSLTRASRDYGISPDTVKRHTTSLKKKGVRWAPKRYDRVSREMAINENGREVWITVSDSRYASLIGKYHNGVRMFLETGDESYLKPFRDKKVKDINGVWHTLDTDPDNLYEIQEMREDEEFYSIYGE